MNSVQNRGVTLPHILMWLQVYYVLLWCICFLLIRFVNLGQYICLMHQLSAFNSKICIYMLRFVSVELREVMLATTFYCPYGIQGLKSHLAGLITHWTSPCIFNAIKQTYQTTFPSIPSSEAISLVFDFQWVFVCGAMQFICETNKINNMKKGVRSHGSIHILGWKRVEGGGGLVCAWHHFATNIGSHDIIYMFRVVSFAPLISQYVLSSLSLYCRWKFRCTSEFQ